MKSEYKRVAALSGGDTKRAVAIEAALMQVGHWKYEEREAFKAGLYKGLEIAQTPDIEHQGGK